MFATALLVFWGFDWVHGYFWVGWKMMFLEWKYNFILGLLGWFQKNLENDFFERENR